MYPIIFTTTIAHESPGVVYIFGMPAAIASIPEVKSRIIVPGEKASQFWYVTHIEYRCGFGVALVSLRNEYRTFGSPKEAISDGWVDFEEKLDQLLNESIEMAGGNLSV